MKSNSNMRSALRIARIELNTMFYSPVAWLVLVIFTFQVGMTFSSVMDSYIHSKVMGYGAYGVTGGLFSGMRGLFQAVTNYLYLYVPLISMGLMSREFAGGSIKLLYSSPIRNSSIIFGKYIAMLVYGLSLMAVMMCYVAYSCIVVQNFDLPAVMTGMLGIFLLLCTYSAIGLFMSTITSYQVVAGVGTLALLAGLNYIGDVGQSTDLLRDITYWLSIKGRVYDFTRGMIPSEAVVYFLALIAFFLTLSILKLNADRGRQNRKRTAAMYGAVCACLLAIAFVSSRPQCKFYWDTTYTQENTLANESIEVMKSIEGPLTITTYVNALDRDAYSGAPVNRKGDYARFEKYTRFKPEIEMKYVYYWADCGNEGLRSRYPGRSDEELADIICRANGMKFKNLLNKEQIDKMIDLSGENYNFVRVVERGDGQKTILRMFNDMERHPGEAEVSAAFKRFVEKSPKVAIITGRSDRTMDNGGSRGYSSFSNDAHFRSSLLNQGFSPLEVDLAQEEIPSDVNIVVLSDLKTPLSEREMQRFDSYLARGGNLLLLGDAGRAQTMNPVAQRLGLEFGQELLVGPVKDQDPTVLSTSLTREAASIYPRFGKLRMHGYRIALPSGVPVMRNGEASDFVFIPLLKTDSTGVWNERETTDFIEDSVVFNPAVGEKQAAYEMAWALTRQVSGKEQRIIAIGDADCISNGGLSTQYWFSASNYSIIQGAFRWMSYEQFPVDTSHPESIDNRISLGRGARMWNKLASLGFFPGLLLVAGLLIIIRRQRG